MENAALYALQLRLEVLGLGLKGDEGFARETGWLPRFWRNEADSDV
jgi:hypothetical protein